MTSGDTPSATHPPDSGRGSLRFAFALIAVVSFLAMGRLVISDFFEIDDPQNIVFNSSYTPPTVAGIASHWMQSKLGLYIPVTYSVWHVIALLAHSPTPDATGGQLSPVPFKLANLAVHVANACLAFLLFRRWLSRDGEASAVLPALLGALLIAVHPVQVESIGWACGMKDLLMTALSLATMLAYSRSIERASDAGRAVIDWRLHGFALALLLLALLSKPTAMVVPVLLVTIDVLIYRRAWRHVGIAVAPFVPVAFLLALLARAIQPSAFMTQVVDPLWRPLLAIDAIAFYLGKLVWPQPLAFDYGRTQHVALASGTPYWSWTIVAALLALLIWLAWKRGDRRWLLPVVLFVIPLGPVLGIVSFDYMDVSAVADHYLALSIVGAGLLVALVVRALNQRVAFGVVIVALVLLAIRSNLQSAHWRDAETYYAHAMRVNPDSWQSESVRSNYLFNQVSRKADRLSTAELQAQFEPSRALARRAIELYQARPGMAEIREVLRHAYPRAAVDHYRLALMDEMIASRPDVSSKERDELLARAQKNVAEAFSAKPDEPEYWRFAIDLYIRRGDQKLAGLALDRLKLLRPDSLELLTLSERIRAMPTTAPALDNPP